MGSIETLIRFSRPHTIIATSIQVLTLFLIMGGWQHFGAAALAALLLTVASALAANIYVVGLNQITDVAIDRINKPLLPLASGRLSLRGGQLIVATSVLLSLALALASGPHLLVTVVTVILIGTVYSLPPLRLKRFSLWAALSIALARGLIANIGVGLHFHAIFGGALPVATLVTLSLFFFGFGLVIAIYKDIPDLDGDRRYGITTFTVRLGPHRALALGRLLLTACYALPIVIALANWPRAEAVFLLASQLLIIGLFWVVSVGVNLERRKSIASFYMFLWLMFYAQCFLLSFYELARVSV